MVFVSGQKSVIPTKREKDMVKMNVTINTEPVQCQGYVSHGSAVALVEVSHVMRVSHGNYRAKAVDLKRDAPYDNYPWLNFLKKKNKHLKLPILKREHVPFNLKTKCYDE